MNTPFDLFVYSDVEDDEKKERDESMEEKIEIDAVEFEIDRTRSKSCRSNLNIHKSFCGTVVTSIIYQDFRRALDHDMLEELGEVVEDGDD